VISFCIFSFRFTVFCSIPAKILGKLRDLNGSPKAAEAVAQGALFRGLQSALQSSDGSVDPIQGRPGARTLVKKPAGLKADNYKKHYMDVRQARSSHLRLFFCFHLLFRCRAIQFADSEALAKAALLH
jgi:hypothetical protein